MTRARCTQKRKLIIGGAMAGCLAVAASAFPQFTSFSDRTGAVLEGHWQSCREADGQYSERIYDGKAAGIGPFELHLGPYHEFALFRGTSEEHRSHESAENLLHPYNVILDHNLAKQHWSAAGLTLDVTLAGGSRDECESWFLVLRRAGGADSH